MRTILALLVGASAGALACSGPKPPAGVVYWISVDVERPSTQVTIDGEVVDPGTGPRGHAVSLKTPFDDWKQAVAGAPFVITASDPRGAVIGQTSLTPGTCLMLCAQSGTCSESDLKFEWQSAEVESSGTVVYGCTRCENQHGTQIGGDCAPAPPNPPPPPP